MINLLNLSGIVDFVFIFVFVLSDNIEIFEMSHSFDVVFFLSRMGLN